MNQRWCGNTFVILWLNENQSFVRRTTKRWIYKTELCPTLVLGIMKLTITLLLFSSLVWAQNNDARTKNFNLKNQVAIEGNDPVSYFDNKPMEGKSEIKLSFKGVIYFFATQQNLSKFKANPEKYEPAYGGWCAYAMGETGEKVKIDPETFKIIDGKLYLFYNFWGNNTLSDWNQNEMLLKAKADQNWKKIVQ
jgi:YHS domain-containing protein